MKEKMTYQEMLAMLKEHQYKAPDRWSELSDQLDLSEQLNQLPSYKAPDNLWGGIEEALDADNWPTETISQGTSTKSLRWAGLIIIVLLGIIAYLLSSRTAHVSEFEYRSETEQVAEGEYDTFNTINVDENLTDIYMYIHANEFIFSEEELEKFKMHLEDLRVAIEAIQKMKENYGQDESVNRLLARVERDKSKLLKEMIAATT